jgi:hypothetical protein
MRSGNARIHDCAIQARIFGRLDPVLLYQFSRHLIHIISRLLICDIHTHQPAMSVHASGWKLQTTWNGDSRLGEV